MCRSEFVASSGHDPAPSPTAFSAKPRGSSFASTVASVLLSPSRWCYETHSALTQCIIVTAD